MPLRTYMEILESLFDELEAWSKSNTCAQGELEPFVSALSGKIRSMAWSLEISGRSGAPVHDALLVLDYQRLAELIAGSAPQLFDLLPALADLSARIGQERKIRFVSSIDIPSSLLGLGPPYEYLCVLVEDIRDAQIAFEGYSEAQERMDENSKRRIPSGPAVDVRVFYHAKNFVCAMRRVARVLEFLKANRSAYGQPAADAIQRTWRKKKRMLDRYTTPRDEIEHIKRFEHTRLIQRSNLSSKGLCVRQDVWIEISHADLSSVIDGLNEILDALHHVPIALASGPQ